MKKFLLPITSIVLLSMFCFLVIQHQDSDNDMTALRKRHEYFLRNSPFKATLKMSKEERKRNGLPPNKYAERQWELTMNPSIGRPEPEKTIKLQEKLRAQSLVSKVPGENANNWVERGPNNIGGRTRAVMFDPNDATNKRVFAGGVSGGLWVNNDITDANSSWTEVNIPQNLAISCITYDPNNTNIFYVGTGESYVQGSVNGNGLYKSTDAGATWTRVFGGVTGETTFSYNAKITVNSPSAIAGVYLALQASYGPQLTTLSGNLVLVDDGTATPTEGCSALINSASINGNIAVVERGSCNFTAKTQNAQNAGATAVLIVNNIGGPPIVAGGTDPGGLTIPTIMISKQDGQNIIAQIGSGVNVTLQPTAASASGRFLTPGIHHINDVKVKDLGGGNSEVYVAAAAAFYANGSPSSIFGIDDYGLYKSSNSGTSWTKLGLPLISGGTNYAPNDIEIGADKKVWIATTNNVYGLGGGTILSSSDGTSFSVIKSITNGVRTELAVSKTNADKIYVLAELSASATNGVEIIRTDNGFTSDISLPLPSDADTGIPATDFTRNQAYYDLTIEVDPLNDNKVYVGGIDLFRSIFSGATWSQLSHWYGGFGFQYVHADQHGIAFGNNASSAMLFSNDGGVYYSNDSGISIAARNKDYNTVQFYKGAIGTDISPNERILGGAQDNANLESGPSTTAGINAFSDINNGGDGAYVFIDNNKQFMIASYVYNSYYYIDYNLGASGGYTIVEDQASGDFINPADFDGVNDVLFTNGTAGSTYQINKYKIGASSAIASSLTNPLLDGSPTAFKISPNNPTTLFVGTDNGKLLKLINTNTIPTWSDITGPDFYGSISSIYVGATDSDLFVTFYNYGVTNIYFTNDGGVTWQNKEGDFPDIPVRAIMANPLNPNEVIIGTDLGVWGTQNFNDASPVWSQAQNGMKDVKVTSFDLRTADNTVLASTYGRGMFTGQFTAAPSTLSINDNTLNALVKVYPTVSDGNFTISSHSQISKGNLNIFDLNGREVYRSKVNFNTANSHRVSLNVSSGMYIVKFTSEGKQSTQKIIIK